MKIENKKPLFRRGSILDGEILRYLEEDCKEYYEIIHEKKSNGIICGFEIKSKENYLEINPGIIKYEKRLYKLKKVLVIKEPEEDGDYYYNIIFYDVTSDIKYEYHTYEIKVSTNETKEKNEFELFRINKREGAKVRNIEKFQGMNKDYNQINLLYQYFSTNTGNSISLEILKIFAREMIKEKELETLDYIFCTSIIEEKITKETLENYINLKLTVDIKNLSNEDVYLKLEKILINSKIKNKTGFNNLKIKNKMMVE